MIQEVQASTSPAVTTHSLTTHPSYAQQLISNYGRGLGKIHIGENYFVTDYNSGKAFLGKLLGNNGRNLSVAIYDLSLHSYVEIKELESQSTSIYATSKKYTDEMNTITFQATDTDSEASLKSLILIDGEIYDIFTRRQNMTNAIFNKAKSGPNKHENSIQLHFQDCSGKGSTFIISKHYSIRIRLCR